MDTHILRATGPTSAAIRVFISSAALLVKVMARISNGLTPCSRISQAMRRVSTRVLPEPAPASTSRGPPVWVTASSWAGFSPSSSTDPKGPASPAVASGNSSARRLVGAFGHRNDTTGVR